MKRFRIAIDVIDCVAKKLVVVTPILRLPSASLWDEQFRLISIRPTRAATIA